MTRSRHQAGADRSSRNVRGYRALRARRETTATRFEAPRDAFRFRKSIWIRAATARRREFFCETGTARRRRRHARSIGDRAALSIWRERGSVSPPPRGRTTRVLDASVQEEFRALERDMGRRRRAPPPGTIMEVARLFKARREEYTREALRRSNFADARRETDARRTIAFVSPRRRGRGVAASSAAADAASSEENSTHRRARSSTTQTPSPKSCQRLRRRWRRLARDDVAATPRIGGRGAAGRHAGVRGVSRRAPPRRRRVHMGPAAADES